MNDDDWSEDYYPQDDNDHNHLISELLRRQSSVIADSEDEDESE